MAYLEELLPEFRKGAKIRSSMWSKIAGLVFVNYKEPLSQTTCYIVGWLSYSFYLIFLEVVRKK